MTEQRYTEAVLEWSTERGDLGVHETWELELPDA